MEYNRTLQLDYAFIPSPNPIRASLPDSARNIIDLQVVISNPTFDEFEFKLIQIGIPIGEEIAADLSTETKLPDPVYDTGGKWNIKIDPIQIDTIRISPKNPGETIKGDAIIFTISGIKINTKPGTVNITLDEDGTEDSDTYSLVKQPFDFPVTKFWTDPAVLPDYDLTSQLYWTCDAILGPNYTYNLREVDGSWQSKNHQWNEGTGINTPLIQEQTTFALDVVKADSSGHSTIIGTMYTQVSVDDPQIPKAYMDPTPTNHYYRLHWLARNTTRCDLLLDNQPLLDHLPIDTYRQGYQVYAGCGPGPHQFTLIAYGKLESSKEVHPFPEFLINSASISFSKCGHLIAITKDNKLAVMANAYLDSISIIDLTKRYVLNPVPVGKFPYSIALTPDDQFALVANEASNTVTVINIPTRSVTTTIPVGKGPYGIAITPDGQYALVVNIEESTVSIIDIQKWSVEPSVIPLGKDEGSFAIAITPDGKLALVVNCYCGYVTVIDVIQRSAESTKIPVGHKPFSIAITPDGTLALVVNMESNSVTVINISQRKVETTIAVGACPWDIAITNDGKFAWVTNSGNQTVTVIDITRRSAAYSFRIGEGPTGIAVTPDNTITMVRTDNGLEFIY